MPAQMNVDPQALAASAGLVEAESRALSAAFEAADTALDAPLSGWVGQSRLAMAAISAQWRCLTATLGDRVAAHADALACTGRVFAEMDARHAAALAEVCRRSGNR